MPYFKNKTIGLACHTALEYLEYSGKNFDIRYEIMLVKLMESLYAGGAKSFVIHGLDELAWIFLEYCHRMVISKQWEDITFVVIKHRVYDDIPGQIAHRACATKVIPARAFRTDTCLQDARKRLVKILVEKSDELVVVCFAPQNHAVVRLAEARRKPVHLYHPDKLPTEWDQA